MSALGDIIAQKLHEIVAEGKIGIDYTFDGSRDKNLALRRKYHINDAKMKEVLLKITGTHYIKSEPSTNEVHPDDVVHIFKILEDLMPRYEENSNYVSVYIYIKITWPEGEEPMFIISFHEDEE